MNCSHFKLSSVQQSNTSKMQLKSIPSTMKGLVHNQATGKLVLRDDLPIPTPEGDEYLLKVHSTALTTGELLWPRPAELNESCPGVEMAGIVIKGGPTSTKFRVGDRVYLRTTYPRAGSAREYTLALESEMALQPKNITADEAASVPVSALTAWQAMFSPEGWGASLEDREKKSVFVNGASGGVGLWATQLAHQAGFTVVGTSTNESLVKSMGATHVINYITTSITDWLEKHQDWRFDLVLDMVGGDSFLEAWHAAKEDGLVLTIVPPKDFDYWRKLERPAGVSSSVSGRFFLMQPNGKHLHNITRLIETGKAKPVVDSVYALEEFSKAFARLDSGRAVGKVVLHIDKNED